MRRFSFPKINWFGTTGQSILVGLIWTSISIIISLKMGVMNPVSHRGIFIVSDHLIGWGASLPFIPVTVYIIRRGILSGYWMVSLILTTFIAAIMSYGWNAVSTTVVTLPTDESKELVIPSTESLLWESKEAHFIQSNTFDLFSSLLLIIGISYAVGSFQLVHLRERSEMKLKDRIYLLTKELLEKGKNNDTPNESNDTVKIPVKMGNKTYFVSTNEVAYISASGNYLELHDLENRHIIRETMTGIMKKLPGHFIRIHKSSIINANFIEALISIGYGDYELKMKDGKQMRISDSYKQEVLNQLKC